MQKAQLFVCLPIAPMGSRAPICHTGNAHRRAQTMTEAQTAILAAGAYTWSLVPRQVCTPAPCTTLRVVVVCVTLGLGSVLRALHL